MLQRIYEGFVAASSAGLLVGDVLVAVNGKPVPNQPTAHKYLSEANGPLELQVRYDLNPTSIQPSLTLITARSSCSALP